MIVAFASDHAGFRLKERLVPLVEAAGNKALDLGVFNETPADYPDQAEMLGRAVLEGKADRGILLCGSGVGASIAANKLTGVRAGLCHDSYSAHQGVEHDDMNVLVIGARVIGPALAFELIEAFLHAQFTGEERHVRRLAKIAALERKAER
jgi:RpiB/LacA/LacB family sugar-phosphate isomerase